MDITSIFKQGLKYPLSNYVNLIIVGIILTVATLIASSGNYTHNRILAIIALILGIIIFIILQGYKLDVIKHGINNENEISFPNLGNFVGGIKAIIVSIVYFIIPGIIVAIVGYLTGASAFTKIINTVNLIQTATSDADIINMTFSTLPETAITSIFNALAITLVVALILFIIFGIFASIAAARLADTGSLGSALHIGQVISKIGSIGWGKVIAYVIILAIITAIIGFIASLVITALGFIPVVGLYLGAIVSALIVVPFLYLFQYYSMGLLYAE